jgi:hypothetical protein
MHEHDAKYLKACRVFLVLLDQHNTTRRFVSTKYRAGNFAPKVFSQHDAREGCTKKHLERAMNILFARGDITNESYSTPSRGLTKIVRIEKEGS